jgi:hypothetical protein
MPPDSPPRPPLVPRPRAKAASHDDVSALSAVDAAEARARAALAQAQAAEMARQDAEERAERAEQRRSRVEVDPSTSSDADQVKAITARGRGWRVAIPIAALTALLAPLTAAVSHFVELERQVSATRALVASYQEQLSKLEQGQAATNRELAELRTSVARLSGYLAAILPSAGVSVPGAEAGAAAVDVETVPQAPGTPKRPKVRVLTRVPAPAQRFP